MPRYRGRLIFPQLAVIARLNTNKTRANDPPGSVDEGYDDVFREPRNFTNAGERDNTRVDDTLTIPCQIEDFQFRELRQLHAGNNPNTRYNLIFHFRDLEKRGLVDPSTGKPLVGTNDRLVEVRDICTKQTIQKFENMYFTEARPGFGIGSGRNLLILKVEERETGASAAT